MDTTLEVFIIRISNQTLLIYKVKYAPIIQTRFTLLACFIYVNEIPQFVTLEHGLGIKFLKYTRNTK